jgi:hypothetical protein
MQVGFSPLLQKIRLEAVSYNLGGILCLLFVLFVVVAVAIVVVVVVATVVWLD